MKQGGGCRVISLAVALCVALATIGLAGPASAAGDDYPYRGQGTCTATGSSSGYCPTSAWLINGGQWDPWGFGYRNCTSFVAWRMRNTNGVNFFNAMTGPNGAGGRWGNANTWDDHARAIGYPVTTTPAVGAIAQTDAGTWGHVAWVSAVNSNGTVTVEQYNQNVAGAFSVQTLPVSHFVYLHVRDLPTNAQPVGHVDSVSSPSPGVIRVRGWTFDPDSPTANLHVHVYVGGPAGSGAPGYDVGATNQARPDVQGVYPQAGPASGFDATVTSAGGSVPVYVYAIDTAGGNNPLLGSTTITVGDPNPTGSLDSVTSPSPGLVTVSGWAFDRSDPGPRIHVHVYVGGPAGSGAPGYDIGVTRIARPDVPGVFAQAGRYTGYRATLPAPAGNVPVYVYGINAGVGANVQVGAKTTAVAAGPAAWPAPGAEVLRVPARTAPGTLRVRWTDLSGRPSNLTYDARWRSRTRGAHRFGSWHYPAAWTGTDARSGTMAVGRNRDYQFQVRADRTVTGAGPSRWSGTRATSVRAG